jgi:hypothetical protein
MYDSKWARRSTTLADTSVEDLGKNFVVAGLGHWIIVHEFDATAELGHGGGCLNFWYGDCSHCIGEQLVGGEVGSRDEWLYDVVLNIL